MDSNLGVESRLANELLQKCLDDAREASVTNGNTEVEKALSAPGARMAIFKLVKETELNPNPDPIMLYFNLFRLGANVALSIRDAGMIK